MTAETATSATENPVLAARLDAGLKQTELAEKAGVSAMTVARAERGEWIRPLNRAAIARALGKDRTELFPPPPAPIDHADGGRRGD